MKKYKKFLRAILFCGLAIIAISGRAVYAQNQFNGKTWESEKIDIREELIQFPPLPTNSGPKLNLVISKPELVRDVQANDEEATEQRLEVALKRLAQQSGRFTVKYGTTVTPETYELKCAVTDLLMQPNGQKTQNELLKWLKLIPGFNSNVPDLGGLIVADDKTTITIACNVSIDIVRNDSGVASAPGSVKGTFKAKELSVQLGEANKSTAEDLLKKAKKDYSTLNQSLLQSRVIETALFQAITNLLPEVDKELLKPRDSGPSEAEKRHAAAALHCSHCGGRLSGNGKFCSDCGEKLNRCESCKNPVNTCERFCIFCGKKLQHAFIGPSQKNVNTSAEGKIEN